MHQKIKIAIIGSPNVGKSTYIGRWTGEFKGIDEHKMYQNTTIGNIEITLSRNVLGSNATIIMCENKNNNSFEYARFLENQMIERKIPYVICCNKVDRGTQTPGYNRIPNICRFKISAKSHYGFENPLLYILRTYFNESNLNLTENEAI
jgi:GTPase SAR1 family protein